MENGQSLNFIFDTLLLV